MNQFNCISCGKCCSHIRGRISKEDKAFLEEFAYGKMPLVQLQPVEKISFPLWSWEIKDLEDDSIKESRAVFDLDSNKAIIVTYFMDSDSCNLLKDNKCVAYSKRPSICRFFPFNKGPFSSNGERADKSNMFSTCPSLDKIYDSIPSDFNSMVKFLNETFPEEFENIVQHDIIMEWVNRTIVDLVKSKKIRAAMNYPYEFLLKRINNAKKIDFTDFLVEIDYYSKQEMNEKIRRFKENLDAKEKIKEFL